VDFSTVLSLGQSMFAFWNPQTGMNWNLMIAWALFLGFFGHFFTSLGRNFSERLLVIVNKIPFFASTQMDEELVAAFERRLANGVKAQMDPAQSIKQKYMLLIDQALRAKDPAKVEELSKQMRRELEDLTKQLITGFGPEAEAIVWKHLELKYGSSSKVAEWMYRRAKAMVEDLKDPTHPSIGDVIASHLKKGSGDLGNG